MSQPTEPIELGALPPGSSSRPAPPSPTRSTVRPSSQHSYDAGGKALADFVPGRDAGETHTLLPSRNRTDEAARCPIRVIRTETGGHQRDLLIRLYVSACGSLVWHRSGLFTDSRAALRP